MKPQLVSEAMAASLNASSMIRKMFEEGARLKAQYGPEAVCDFSLGNPLMEPPQAFYQALRGLLESHPPGLHRYPPNAGLPETRDYVARQLAAESGLPVTGQQLVMTCGAGGGLNVVFKALLNPGDEVLALAPYFVEYGFYVANHGGKLVEVATGPGFLPDLQALSAALTPRTRALLINSPNNPTGVVYGQETLAALGGWLAQAEKQLGRPLLLVSDEPYKKLLYDGAEAPCLFNFHPNTVVVTSHSKDLGLAGERIGYAAVSPKAQGGETLVAAMILANRILGFVNAPVLMQRLLPALEGQSVDVARYQALRNAIMEPLLAMGYQMVRPQGAFYLFPQAPGGDDLAFVEAAKAKRLLLVPGRAFGLAGHFRLAYCVEEAVIQRSLPLFKALMEELG